MGSVVVFAILVLIVGLIIRSMVRDHKAGKSLQCGEDCSACGGVCPYLKSPNQDEDVTYKKI